MEINQLDNENNLTTNENNSLSNEVNNNLVEVIEQNNFLETTLGKTINTGIDIGLRAVLPDFIENQIIDLKDNMINYGLKDGIKKSVSDAIEFGKSAIGIVTGNFENISQMQSAIHSGGVIDSVSELIDEIINRLKKAGLINSTVASTIKQGKNVILNNVENNIEKTFTNQIRSMESMEKNIANWKEAFNNKDMETMEKEYKHIKTELKNLVPLEKNITTARVIENLHNLIKNNGNNFELSQEEMALANKLI